MITELHSLDRLIETACICYNSVGLRRIESCELMLMLSDDQFAASLADTHLRKSNSFFGVSCQQINPNHRLIWFPVPNIAR